MDNYLKIMPRVSSFDFITNTTNSHLFDNAPNVAIKRYRKRKKQFIFND